MPSTWANRSDRQRLSIFCRTVSAMSAHAFVDETTRGGYYLAAAVVLPGDLAQARKAVSSLVLAGQRRIHFNKESDRRRREILSTITTLKAAVVLYDASRYNSNTKAARRACLERLVWDLAARRVQRLVIEQDDSLVENDRRVLYRSVRFAGCADTLTYVHHRAYEECLLAIPDAVAWCWTRGGTWRTAVEPIVEGVQRI